MTRSAISSRLQRIMRNATLTKDDWSAQNGAADEKSPPPLAHERHGDKKEPFHMLCDPGQSHHRSPERALPLCVLHIRPRQSRSGISYPPPVMIPNELGSMCECRHHLGMQKASRTLRMTIPCIVTRYPSPARGSGDDQGLPVLFTPNFLGRCWWSARLQPCSMQPSVTAFK